MTTGICKHCYKMIAKAVVWGKEVWVHMDTRLENCAYKQAEPYEVGDNQR